MGTYAEVELKVTVKLSQPWSDEETANVIRNRATLSAEQDLVRALTKGDMKNVTINRKKTVMIYSKTEDEVYVNLYASSEAKVNLAKNNLIITQKTNYPWNGDVQINVFAEAKEKFNIKMRIPGWAKNEVLPGGLYDYVNDMTGNVEVYLDGKKEVVNSLDGYITLSGEKIEGKTIALKFPMNVRVVETSLQVAENRGKVALEYGPIVYAIEEIDNKSNFDAITIPSNDDFKVQMEQNLLGGVNTIFNGNLKAIPYYAWSNRGTGKMKVWIAKENQ